MYVNDGVLKMNAVSAGCLHGAFPKHQNEMKKILMHLT